MVLIILTHLDSTELSILPRFIEKLHGGIRQNVNKPNTTYLKEEIARAVLVCLAHKRIEENLDITRQIPFQRNN